MTHHSHHYGQGNSIRAWLRLRPWQRYGQGIRASLRLRPWQRHSLVLSVAGLVYIAFGAVYLLVPLTSDRRDGIRLALMWTGGHVAPWGCVWVLVGLLALLSTRWPPASKTWGYTAMSGLAAMWGGFYLVAVVFLHVPHAGISGALVWFLVAFLWWAISGLVNPDDIAPPAQWQPHETVPHHEER